MDGAARGRLLLALLASVALHLSLIFGVTVRAPAPPSAAQPILARIDGSAYGPAPPSRESATYQATPRQPDFPARSQRPSAPSARVSVPALADEASPHSAPPPPDDPLPPVEMPLLADPTWYPAAQLDVFPVAREPVRLAFPEGAAAASGGEVTLLLLIDETGSVHECSVVDAQPAGVFEEAALAAFRAARFAPGRKDGREVRSRVLVKVAFSPSQPLAASP